VCLAECELLLVRLGCRSVGCETRVLFGHQPIEVVDRRRRGFRPACAPLSQGVGHSFGERASVAREVLDAGREPFEVSATSFRGAAMGDVERPFPVVNGGVRPG